MTGPGVQEKGEKIPERVDLDTILVEEIGQFGKFQLRTVGLAVVLVVFTAWSSAEFVFTTSRIATRCLIPECDGDRPEFAPYWLVNAVPTTSTGFINNCQRFGNTSISRTVASTTCPASLFDRDTLVTCHQRVYQNTHSVVYDYDLGCDEWRRTLIGSLRTTGALFALPITGYISDRWGRRVALTFNAFNTAWLGVARYWANTYIGFVLSEFFESVLGVGTFSCIYILLLELIGPRYRTVAGALLNTSFAIGQILLSLLVWAVPYWRSLTLVIYIPQLFTIIYYWIMPESVRWYMSKDRYEESEALLKKVARVNGKKISQECLKNMRATAEQEKAKALKAESNDVEPWLIVQVFQHKSVLLRCLVSPVWWITMTFIYYGMSINAVNMSGNSYLNYVAVHLAEIPGYWSAVYLLGRIGRKPVIVGAYWMCAICQISFVFMPSDLYAVSLAVYLIGTYSIAIVVIAMYLYTAEIYPTKYRHRLFAYSSMIGRIGSILAPLTPAMGDTLFEEFPFVLFGGLALLSGFLVLLTPETRGTNLPDTMKQANQLGMSKEDQAK